MRQWAARSLPASEVTRVLGAGALPIHLVQEWGGIASNRHGGAFDHRAGGGPRGQPLLLFPPLGPLLLQHSIFPSIRVFSSESALCIRWPKYRSFCFSNRPSNDYSGLISFRTDWCLESRMGGLIYLGISSPAPVPATGQQPHRREEKGQAWLWTPPGALHRPHGTSVPMWRILRQREIMECAQDHTAGQTWV